MAGGVVAVMGIPSQPSATSADAGVSATCVPRIEHPDGSTSPPYDVGCKVTIVEVVSGGVTVLTNPGGASASAFLTSYPGWPSNSDYPSDLSLQMPGFTPPSPYTNPSGFDYANYGDGVLVYQSSSLRCRGGTLHYDPTTWCWAYDDCGVIISITYTASKDYLNSGTGQYSPPAFLSAGQAIGGGNSRLGTYAGLGFFSVGVQCSAN